MKPLTKQIITSALLLGLFPWNLELGTWNLELRNCSAQTINTFAGNGAGTFSGDGGPAVNATLSSPSGVAVDASGNIYIADAGNSRIRMINTSGIISTFAGNGASTFSGDGGPATSAQLSSPSGVAADASGNVYIADMGNWRIRKVNTSGIISTIAGDGTFGYGGDGGPAISAQLRSPYGVAVDASGNVYIADYQNCRVRMVNTSGIISTFAGDGTFGYGGDGGPAVNAQLGLARGVALDASGNVYISDAGNCRVRMVNTSGVISTFAGNGTTGFSGDGGPAISAQLYSPYGVAVDASGNVYIADYTGSIAGYFNHRIRMINTSGVISTFAGSSVAGFSGDGGPAANAQLYNPYGSCADASGNVYIADAGNGRIRKVNTSGVISTIAGNGAATFSGDGGPAVNAKLAYPSGVALDASGNVYISDMGNWRIRKVNTSGVISTIAGNGFWGFGGDGGPATDAMFTHSWGIAADASGNVYIADFYNNRIRKVNTSGIISTFAGTGTNGSGGDGGPATSAQLSYPMGVAVDVSGNVYIADAYNNRIRMVNTSGIISTVAGGGGSLGDGGPATSAQLYNPRGVAVDVSGNVYIGDYGNYRVRKVNTSGIISTIAGTGTNGFSGDGGPATSAMLYLPMAVAVDASGNVYIDDTYIHRIRMVNTSGIISTFAGTGTAGFSGDGGPAASAMLSGPWGVAANASCVYIADMGNRRIRVVDAGGSCSSSLPVQLLYFRAQCDAPALKGVIVKWATASETNNDYFTIERSTNLQGFGNLEGFDSIATVKGAGNSSTTRYYEFIDQLPSLSPLPKGAGGMSGEGPGVRYYRLKQTDFNGQSREYEPVSVTDCGAFNLISIFPNPANDYIEYLLGSAEGAEVTVTLYDALGREVYNKEETIGKGLFKEKIGTQNFASGNYLLRITNGSKEKTQKQFVIK